MKKIFPIFIVLLLVACGKDDEVTNPMENNPAEDKQSNGIGEQLETPLNDETDTGTQKMTEGIKAEQNPKYPMGSKVKIMADHIDGMEGAEGEVVGAYDTTAYEVKYLPTTGGEKVTYKWVIDQELEGASGAPLQKGLDVVITANHVEGMEGASGEVLQSNESTVYMVSFTTTKGKKIENYKWLTEEELSSAD